MAVGVYSKVVSTTKRVDSIHTFIGGVRKEITSAWTFVGGVRKQVFPSSEYYSEIYSKTNAGSYSQSLTYGKYKIVISGAGGSGSAIARNTTSRVTINYIQSGYAGQEQTIYIEIPSGVTKTLSGVIGQGGTAAYARADDTHDDANAGLGGSGYASGQNGSRSNERYTETAQGQMKITSFGIASGGGGGSSSVLLDGVLNAVALGGNGGSAEIRADARGKITRNGGVGGSGGVTNGTGAAGGVLAQIYSNAGYSGAGTDGYIHIYKSNIYPN